MLAGLPTIRTATGSEECSEGKEGTLDPSIYVPAQARDDGDFHSPCPCHAPKAPSTLRRQGWSALCTVPGRSGPKAGRPLARLGRQGASALLKPMYGVQPNQYPRYLRGTFHTRLRQPRITSCLLINCSHLGTWLETTASVLPSQLHRSTVDAANSAGKCIRLSLRPVLCEPLSPAGPLPLLPPHLRTTSSFSLRQPNLQYQIQACHIVSRLFAQGPSLIRTLIRKLVYD